MRDPYDPKKALESTLAAMSSSAGQHPLMFLRLAARLAAIGPDHRLTEAMALVGNRDDFEQLVVERCEIGVGELKTAPGEDLALAVIAAQDLTCLLRLRGDKLPDRVGRSIRALADAAENARLDSEAAAAVEGFREQFQIPPEYRLGIVDSPVSEFEMAVVARVELAKLVAEAKAARAGKPETVAALPGQRVLEWAREKAEGLLRAAAIVIEHLEPPAHLTALPVMQAADQTLGLSIGEEETLGNEEEAGRAAEAACWEISLVDELGKYALQRVEPAPEGVRGDEFLREIGEAVLRERLPWAGGTVHIERFTDEAEPTSASYLATVDDGPGGTPKTGRLCIVLKSTSKFAQGEAAARLTADVRSDYFRGALLPNDWNLIAATVTIEEPDNE